MMSFQVIGSFLLAFASGTSMMLCIRYLSSESPFLTNAIAWFVFGLVCLVIWFFMRDKSSEITIHPVAIVLWISIAVLNVSYGLLYAAKVPTAYAPIIITGVMTVLLGITWWYLFGEAMTSKFIIGAALILVGMVVMMR